MNKQELVDAIFTETGDSREAIRHTINAAFDLIKTEVARGGQVSLVGFGTFEKRSRAARVGRDPQRGEKIQVPAKNTPFFRAAASFKAVVEENPEPGIPSKRRVAQGQPNS